MADSFHWYDDTDEDYYLDSLKSVSISYGIDGAMIDEMMDMGMDYEEIEEIIYDPEMRKEALDVLR